MIDIGARIRTPKVWAKLLAGVNGVGCPKLTWANFSRDHIALYGVQPDVKVVSRGAGSLYHVFDHNRWRQDFHWHVALLVKQALGKGEKLAVLWDRATVSETREGEWHRRKFVKPGTIVVLMPVFRDEIDVYRAALPEKRRR